MGVCEGEGEGDGKGGVCIVGNPAEPSVWAQVRYSSI